MLSEILKKKKNIEKNAPWPMETATYIRELNALDWIATSLKLDGGNLSRESIKKMIAGEFITDVSLGEHQLIMNYESCMELCADMAELDIEIDVKHLDKIHACLVTPEKSTYRERNPVLLALDYNPPHFHEVSEQLKLVFHEVFMEDFGEDVVRKAVFIHNRIIEVYPYETQSEGTARCALQYELVRQGYPPIPFSLSESEYNHALIAYLKKGNEEPIYSATLRALYNKLDLIERLLDEAADGR